MIPDFIHPGVALPLAVILWAVYAWQTRKAHR